VLTLHELITLPAPLPRSRTIARTLAELLDGSVGPGSVVLETGVGLSTLVILHRQPRQHLAVQPDPEAFAAILDLAAQQGIDTRKFLAVVARPQDYLPSADLPDLDLVLLEGDHAFPRPFVEWYYAAEKLRIGGLMIVDNPKLRTGTILADFMRADPKWEEVIRDKANHVAIYRKRVHPVHDDDWARQPYVHDSYWYPV
jgi:predicted O-methyltransferase YrrM